VEYIDGVEGAGEGDPWERCDRAGIVMKRLGFCDILLSVVAVEASESETRLGELVVCFDSRASAARRLFRRWTMRARQQEYAITAMNYV